MGANVAKPETLPAFGQGDYNLEKGALIHQTQQQQFDDIFVRSHHIISSLSKNPLDQLKGRITQCFEENTLQILKSVYDDNKKFNDTKNYKTITKNFAELNKECDAIMKSPASLAASNTTKRP